MPNIRAYSMALFGQIDQIASDADQDPSPMNDAVLATVENLLPNSTGLGQRGWYRELQVFLNSPKVREGREPFEFPGFEDARAHLADLPRVTRTLGDPVVLDDDRHPALARAAYASVIFEKIRQVRSGYLEQPEIRDNQMLAILPGVLDAWPTVREGELLSGDDKAFALEGRIAEIVDQKSFVRIAGEQVSEQFAERAKPCFGTLEDSGGQYCSTLYTDSEDDELTVDEIEKILHPLNWDICCPTFFHKMAEQLPNRFTADRWYRIVESISAEPDEYLLNTALIFSLEKRDDGLIINYRLDPNRQNEGLSAGIVEIDNGYIWVTPTRKRPDGKGVRIRTSKEERVNGLSPTATSALGCLLGWSDAGKEMLAGTARKAMNNDLQLPQGRTLKSWPSSAAFQQQFVDNSPPTIPPDVPPTLPINFPDTVDDAGRLAKSLIDRVTSNLGDAASRWLDGLIKDDVEDVTKQMGKDLKDWSMDVYKTAERNVKPPKEKANG
ncbi:MAG: hypothetical protein ACRDU5_10280 [Mycobacterium sp.]